MGVYFGGLVIEKIWYMNWLAFMEKQESFSNKKDGKLGNLCNVSVDEQPLSKAPFKNYVRVVDGNEQSLIRSVSTITMITY